MEANDAAVVAQVLAGEGDAYRVLVERHSRSVFRLAFRMTANEQDAEDVVQETFLRAYKQLARYESRASFGTWLYRIAANYSLDLIRARKTRATVKVEDEDGVDRTLNVATTDAGPDRLLFSRDIAQRIERALETLSQQERTAFILRHYEGQSIEEIGGTLGLGTNATKHSIFRAVQKLRRILEPVVT